MRIDASRVVDASGDEAAAFGAQVSGHVVVASATGRIVFSGGITPGRGHAGPCKGLVAFHDAITRALDAPPNATQVDVPTPRVFGCPLFNEEPCRPESPICNQEHASHADDGHRTERVAAN